MLGVEEREFSRAEGHVKLYSSHGALFHRVHRGCRSPQVSHCCGSLAVQTRHFYALANRERCSGRDVEVVLLSEVEGTVKSFSDHCSYGFVSCDGIGGDGWFVAASLVSQPFQQLLEVGLIHLVRISQPKPGTICMLLGSSSLEGAIVPPAAVTAAAAFSSEHNCLAPVVRLVELGEEDLSQRVAPIPLHAMCEEVKSSVELRSGARPAPVRVAFVSPAGLHSRDRS